MHVQAKGRKAPDADRVYINICIRPEVFDLVKEEALKEDRSFSNMVSVLLKRALNANKH